MINIFNVISVLKIKLKHMINQIETQPSALDIDVADKISNIFLDLVYNCEINETTTLTIKEKEHCDSPINIDKFSQQTSQNKSQSNPYSQNSEGSVSTTFTLNDSVTIDNEDFSIEYMQNVIKYCAEHPSHSFKTINHIFRRVKHRNYISRFKSYFQNMGSRITKFQEIKESVYQKFVEARNSRLPIHDIDLQR